MGMRFSFGSVANGQEGTYYTGLSGDDLVPLGLGRYQVSGS
jgi:hypothetical protein